MPKKGKVKKIGKARLNILLARHLFGFVKEGGVYRCMRGNIMPSSKLLTFQISSEQGKSMLMSLASPAERKKISFKKLPDFISDPKYSGLVHKMLRASHRFCCIKIDSDYDYCHDVWLTPSEFFKKNRTESSMHAPLIHGYSPESLELALAVTALVAFFPEKCDILEFKDARARKLGAEERRAQEQASKRKNSILRKFYQARRAKKA